MNKLLILLLAASLEARCLADELAYPPVLPGGLRVASGRSNEFLQRPETVRPDVAVARTAPAVDFLYYPEQNYPGRPWSVWGDGLAVAGKYYSSIGDHLGPRGNAFLFEYDPDRKRFKTLVNVQDLLKLPEGHYTPGKIHSRIDLGSDGWLYFSTHRGSTRVTTDEYHYEGDWIIRHHPGLAKSEIVARGPVPKHCIPTSLLDPERMIFYGGTAAGNRKDPVHFFAFDLRSRRVLHAVPEGPYRALMFARSTGCVYYVNSDGGPLMKYDPESGRPPTVIPGAIGLRAATQETADGLIYTVSTRPDATLWRFNTRNEQIEKLGKATVGTQTYITSLDIDPSGRYLYYVPGAHGGSPTDGSAVVQYDVRTKRRKVIAFLHPHFQKRWGFTPVGCFGAAIDSQGEKLYLTWNGNRSGPDRRGRLRFDTCALTVIHVPESERP